MLLIDILNVQFSDCWTSLIVLQRLFALQLGVVKERVFHCWHSNSVELCNETWLQNVLCFALDGTCHQKMLGIQNIDKLSLQNISRHQVACFKNSFEKIFNPACTMTSVLLLIKHGQPYPTQNLWDFTEDYSQLFIIYNTSIKDKLAILESMSHCISTFNVV